MLPSLPYSTKLHLPYPDPPHLIPTPKPNPTLSHPALPQPIPTTPSPSCPVNAHHPAHYPTPHHSIPTPQPPPLHPTAHPSHTSNPYPTQTTHSPSTLTPLLHTTPTPPHILTHPFPPHLTPVISVNSFVTNKQLTKIYSIPADIVCLCEQSFLHRTGNVCTL